MKNLGQKFISKSIIYINSIQQILHVSFEYVYNCQIGRHGMHLVPMSPLLPLLCCCHSLSMCLFNFNFFPLCTHCCGFHLKNIGSVFVSPFVWSFSFWLPTTTKIHIYEWMFTSSSERVLMEFPQLMTRHLKWQIYWPSLAVREWESMNTEHPERENTSNQSMKANYIEHLPRCFQIPYNNQRSPFLCIVIA